MPRNQPESHLVFASYERDFLVITIQGQGGTEGGPMSDRHSSEVRSRGSARGLLVAPGILWSPAVQMHIPELASRKPPGLPGCSLPGASWLLGVAPGMCERRRSYIEWAS